jgi:hypothetical protein
MIDRVGSQLLDEGHAASVAYIVLVSRGRKSVIRRLFFGRGTAGVDRAVALEAKLGPKERQRAARLAAYDGEMQWLYHAATRLEFGLERAYAQQRRYERGGGDAPEKRVAGRKLRVGVRS